MAKIECVRVLKGARRFNSNNVNPTYKGTFLTRSGVHRSGIFKDLNKQQLVNELLSASIARDLGLPVPDSFLGFVEKGNSDLTLSQFPLANGTGNFVFVSADVGVPNLAQRIVGPSSQFLGNQILEILKKWAHLGNTYAFDTWVANTDRHNGNILFEFPMQIWLIDHGHALTGPNWKIADLKPLEQYTNRLSEWLSSSLSAHQKSARSVEAKKCSDELKLVSYPDHIKVLSKAKLISDSEARAIRAFLDARVAVVPKQANDALGVLTLVK